MFPMLHTAGGNMTASEVRKKVASNDSELEQRLNMLMRGLTGCCFYHYILIYFLLILIIRYDVQFHLCEKSCRKSFLLEEEKRGFVCDGRATWSGDVLHYTQLRGVQMA
jgi:hypothetical protein